MKRTFVSYRLRVHKRFLSLPRRPTVLCRDLLLAFIFCSNVNASESIPNEALDCLIEPWVVSDVGSPVQGVINRLMVDRGEVVKKGQPIAKLESQVESSELAIAEARVKIQSEILARESEFKLAELEQARQEDLHSQKMITAQQRDESHARFQIATAALTQALENQKIQQLEMRRSQQNYARRTLTSPIDGVVVRQLAFAGEFVYDNPVMTIAAIDSLRVEVMLPARLYGTIAKGDVARVYPELKSDSILMSTVDVVDAMLDSRSGTFGVRLQLPNDDNKVPAGQRCRIVFEPTISAAQPDNISLDEKPAQNISSGH